MSSKNIAIEFNTIWKKYSKDIVFHRNLREDIVNLFSMQNKKESNKLSENEFWALKDINLKISKGETIGFYGPNGAGKSTILKLIANVTYPSRGNLTVNGRIAPLLEIGAGFHPDLSGEENVFVNGAILGMTIPEIKKKMDQIIEFSGVGDFINMPVKKYSSGMYVRLAFSVAIHSETDIYLFDEVVAVGDQNFQNKCIDKIKELKSNNKTILIVAHNHEMIGLLSDEIIYLEKGQLKNKEK